MTPQKMDNDPPQIQQCLNTSPNIHIRVKKGAKLICRYTNTKTVEVTARFLWRVWKALASRRCFRIASGLRPLGHHLKGVVGHPRKNLLQSDTLLLRQFELRRVRNFAPLRFKSPGSKTLPPCCSCVRFNSKGAQIYTPCTGLTIVKPCTGFTIVNLT